MPEKPVFHRPMGDDMLLPSGGPAEVGVHPHLVKRAS